MFRLLVDFNAIEDDRVSGLQRYAEAPRSLTIGDRVLVHDDGSEEAWGIVDAVRDELVRVLVDWSTFGPPGRFHAMPGGWLAGATLATGGPAQPRVHHVVQVSSADLIWNGRDNSVKTPA
ncbi:MAG: hypothetical protein WKF94_00790 [Solirubrobacteraceae bacterium]